MVAGQAGAALHTMAILQAYQAEVLKEMDEGDVVTPEAIKELRRATNLALRATKHTARAVGRSLATAERHLWLNLTDIREKEKASRSPALAYSVTRLTPSSISSGLPSWYPPWYISLRYLVGTCQECRPGFFVRSNSVTHSNLLATWLWCTVCGPLQWRPQRASRV